jgi:hypothetical protein
VKLHTTGGDPRTFARALQLGSPDELRIIYFIATLDTETEEEHIARIMKRFSYLKRLNNWLQMDKHLRQYLNEHQKSGSRHAHLIGKNIWEEVATKSDDNQQRGSLASAAIA